MVSYLCLWLPTLLPTKKTYGNLLEIYRIRFLNHGWYYEILMSSLTWLEFIFYYGKLYKYNNFNNFIQRNNLIDLKFSSNPFAWHNKTKEHAAIFSRLDRAMANHQYLCIYPSTVFEHIPIIGSNYGPILIDTNTRNLYKSKNFRF